MRSYRKGYMSADQKTIVHIPAPGTDINQLTIVALFPPHREDLPFELWNYFAPIGTWVGFSGTEDIYWAGFNTPDFTADPPAVASLGNLGTQLHMETGLETANRIFTWDYYENHPLD